MRQDEARIDKDAEKALELLQRALSSGNPRPLDKCVALYAAVLAVTPADHPSRDRAALLSNLAIAYRLRSERTGSAADFDHAIGTTSEAVELTPPDHAERTSSLFDLAEMLITRYERLHVPGDLDRAYAAAEEGMRTTGVEHPMWLPRLLISARSRRLKFERDGVDGELDLRLLTSNQSSSILARRPVGRPRTYIDEGTRPEVEPQPKRVVVSIPPPPPDLSEY